MCLTASDDESKVMKVEEGSYVSEQEDPLALTVPATKAEEEVSYVQLTAFVAGYELCLSSHLFSMCFQDSSRLLFEHDRAALLETT
jgi:hypothetical protein